MCLSEKPEAPPPAPVAPAVLEQSAPERAGRTDTEEKKKKIGTKAYRTNPAALGTISKGGPADGPLGGIKKKRKGSIPTISK